MGNYKICAKKKVHDIKMFNTEYIISIRNIDWIGYIYTYNIYIYGM